MYDNKKIYLKDGESKLLQNIPAPQNEERKPRPPPRKFTPLTKYLYDIMKKLMDQQMIVLPKIWPERPDARDSKWYNENDYYQ